MAESVRLIYESMLPIKTGLNPVFLLFFPSSSYSLLLYVTLDSTRPDLPTIRQDERWLSNHQKCHELLILIAWRWPLLRNLCAHYVPSTNSLEGRSAKLTSPEMLPCRAES